LAAVGHPSLGDALCADAATLALAPRLLLHASALAFDHPTHGRPCRFELPADFDQIDLQPLPSKREQLFFQ